MNAAEIDTLKAATWVLDQYGYHAAAEALREALLAEATKA